MTWEQFSSVCCILFYHFDRKKCLYFEIQAWELPIEVETGFQIWSIVAFKSAIDMCEFSQTS